MTIITTNYVGLDVHKDSIFVAVAKDDGQPAETFGPIPSTAEAVLKMLNKITSAHSLLDVVYEAGPTGFELCRILNKHNIKTSVVAPSLVPKSPTDKIKTDRRDAKKLAEYQRSHLLTSIYVPDPACEALRDLVRVRHEAVRDRVRVSNRIKMFLLHMNIFIPPEIPRLSTSLKYRSWLKSVSFEFDNSQTAFNSMISELEERINRVTLLDTSISQAAKEHPKAGLINALGAFRGISLLSAVTIVAEVDDFRRFKSAPAFMSYVGVIPSEHSSGNSRRQGRITKTGNNMLRHILTESAHHARHVPKVGVTLQKRQKDVPENVKEIAWKAQLRLNHKYRNLSHRLNVQKAVTAVSRELAGFIWAAAIEYENS